MYLVKEVKAATVITQGNAAPLQDLEIVFGNIVAAVLSLAGIILFIMLLLGGFKYLTSGGDPKAAESAKNTLTYAIGGLILISLAYLALRFINVLTGVDVLNFYVYRPAPTP